MSNTFKSRLAQIPEGAGALFFVQMFSTLGFAVLYSTLVLYATKHLQFSTKDAAAMMGVFGAFNYGLHLFGGYLGGRLMSNRNLFVGGMVLQVIGCGWMSTGTVQSLYGGLALFLTGSGLNVTCLNMMLTQRFAPEDMRREGAFFWNYAGMNVGFTVGFSAAGYFQLSGSYSELFIFAAVGNVLAIVLALVNWKSLADLSTPLLQATPQQFRLRFAACTAILVGLVPLVWYMLQRPDSTGSLVKWIGAGIALVLLWLTLRHPEPQERRNMWAYLVLTIGSLVFWTLYQMAPNGLQTFADANVDMVVWGFTVAPQWIQNINTMVIVIGGPTMSALFVRLRARGWQIDVPQQFALSLALMGTGFLLLPAGISMADGRGLVGFGWLFGSFALQAVGELLISPVGYAMIGKLAPRQHQGVMMGAWMLVTGVASVYAGEFSGMLPEAAGSTPAATNPAYAEQFMQLGLGTLAVGAALAVSIPFLRRLIRGKDTPADDQPVAVVVPR
ncbi:MAG TPA: oligopeptide:H+ symporter [Ideonella sp.]|uniref:peptide MFS transporter n=1 Tax=Ideonella sp. TaxID=1929293 RepID=UPI002E33FFC6|nr:oligopeptide:H+ symporter [Ideonella sp.]HEX5684598.1 oligopeptide:H+ symporter [Ideonella sp.]